MAFMLRAYNEIYYLQQSITIHRYLQCFNPNKSKAGKNYRDNSLLFIKSFNSELIQMEKTPRLIVGANLSEWVESLF